MLDKRQVAHAFSRAAVTYDKVASLQRRVGEQLLIGMDALNLPTSQINFCLDLGCGTGFFQPCLQQRFRQAEHIACDLAEGMLRQVQQQNPRSCYQAAAMHLLAADAEQLPLARASIDCVFSSLALQWCEQLPQLFNEVARVLTPGGYCCFSTLGPATLTELKQAWASVDDYQHVNQFTDFDTYTHTIKAQGLSIVKTLISKETTWFASLKQLAQSFKQLGAHNMNTRRALSLTGKQRWRALQQAYQIFCNREGQHPASYEVYYFYLKKEV